MTYSLLPIALGMVLRVGLGIAIAAAKVPFALGLLTVLCNVDIHMARLDFSFGLGRAWVCPGR